MRHSWATYSDQRFHRVIPADAKFVVRGGVRYARFRTKKGQTVEGLVLPDGKRCRVQTSTYYGRVRDSLGRQRRVPLGVTDQEAARQLRAKLQREADQKKAGLIDEYADARRRPLIGSTKGLSKSKHQRDRYGRISKRSSELAWEELKRAIEGSHLDDFEVHLRASDRSETHIRETIRVIRRTAIACGFQQTDDLDASKLDRHLVSLIDAQKSRRTRNGALKGLRSMVSWMIRTDRLARDPFRGISTVNEEADPNRRRRRALTPDELAKVVRAAEHSAGTIEGVAGPTRAILYLVAAATGLRRKELSEIQRHHLSLAASPYIHIPAASTKAKRDDHPLPLHPFIAERLRVWLASWQNQNPNRLFDLTTASGRLRKTSKMMKGDCEAAGVPYLGDIGVADFHSHRVAFITQLCRTCSDFSTVVDLARHRDPKLTAKIYDRVRIETRTAAINGLPITK